MPRPSVPERGSSEGSPSSRWSCCSRRSSCCSPAGCRRRRSRCACPAPTRRLHRRDHGQPGRTDRRRRRHPDQARRDHGDPDHAGQRQVQLLGHRARRLPGRRRPGHSAQGLRAAAAGQGRPAWSRRRPSRSTTSSSGAATAATLTVRAADFDDSTSKFDEFLQSSVNGLRLGPAAGPGQRRPEPDLRHDRALELRARRAGDPRRHDRLRPGQRRPG